jgi:hypothetical protein
MSVDFDSFYSRRLPYMSSSISSSLIVVGCGICVVGCILFATNEALLRPLATTGSRKIFVVKCTAASFVLVYADNDYA